MGNEDARFVALQGSRNGESLLAGNMGEGVRVARDNPDSGVVVRLAGDDRPGIRAPSPADASGQIRYR
jgi:hypothetical protein